MGSRKMTIILVLLSITTISLSQNCIDSSLIRPKNAIYVSIVGDASMFATNYEREFLNSKYFFISGKVGVGYNENLEFCIFAPCNTKPDQYLTIPHQITGNLGHGVNYFEFGIGGTIVTNNSNTDYLPYYIFGYRIQPKKSRLMFRFFANIPFYNDIYDSSDFFFMPAGIAIGYSL